MKLLCAFLTFWGTAWLFTFGVTRLLPDSPTWATIICCGLGPYLYLAAGWYCFRLLDR